MDNTVACLLSGNCRLTLHNKKKRESSRMKQACYAPKDFFLERKHTPVRAPKVLILDANPDHITRAYKQNRSFRRKNIRYVTALDLIKGINGDCSLRAHLFLSYHLI